MTTIAPDWLSAPATRKILAALAPASPLFVGGCVRDALMGRATRDIDIAVASPPEETMRLAEDAGLSAHPTGVEHGVVTLSTDGAAFEAATLRRDVETDGRRAVVAFSKDPAEDAARRDFTMNALYADPDGQVIDPLGTGLPDLESRRIRFIGDAETRIREDYLRILRFFRFHAQFVIETFDTAGLAACRSLTAGLSHISKERIGAEILKMLSAPDPEPALAAMGEVLTAALPGAAFEAGLSEAERTLSLALDPIRRLCALGPSNAKAALRLSNADAAALEAMRAARTKPLSEAAYRHGVRAAEAALALALARGAAPPPNWRERIERGSAVVFPVRARDLIAAGEDPGPALGARLRNLEDQWIAADFALSKEQLLG
ncbi:MAG: CCA tRNA nucleotidyltransferase [Pseudomonadota bacterium]